MNRFKTLPLWGQIAIGLFAAAIVFELVMLLGAGLGGSGDERSSSYSTRPDGLAAYADLLVSAGHRVERARQTLDELDLPDGATVVLAGSSLSDDEAVAMAEFVGSGGRLVVAGRQPSEVVRDLIGAPVEWRAADSGSAQVLAPLAETSGVANVDSEAWQGLDDLGPAVPVLAVNDDVVAAVADVGRGRVVLLGTALPLVNAQLAQADNAVFGLGIAGPADRPVVFAEAGHTGSSGTGVGALPTEWKWALVAGFIATLLAMWSAGRRFGPPEDESRDLPPPRKAYVDAVASTLVKTKQPDASLAPLRRAAREQLARQAVLPADASDEQLRRAAQELELPQDEIDALFGAVTGDDKAMALGRAMARLGGTKW